MLYLIAIFVETKEADIALSQLDNALTEREAGFKITDPKGAINFDKGLITYYKKFSGKEAILKTSTIPFNEMSNGFKVADQFKTDAVWPRREIDE